MKEKNQLQDIFINLIEEIENSIEDIKTHFSKKFSNILNNFDSYQANKLFFHCLYDHQIEILDNSRLFKSKLYHILLFEHKKIR